MKTKKIQIKKERIEDKSTIITLLFISIILIFLSIVSQFWLINLIAGFSSGILTLFAISMTQQKETYFETVEIKVDEKK